MSKFDKAILAQWRELAADMERSGEGGSALHQRSHRGVRGEGSGADDPMSQHREALEKIRDFAALAKANPARFRQPDPQQPANDTDFRKGHQAGLDYCAEIARAALEEPTQHGVSCPKVQHDPKRNYLHSEDDDTPYDVDGCRYCGRCHYSI